CPHPCDLSLQRARPGEAVSEVLFTIRGIQLRLGGRVVLEELDFEVVDRVRPGQVTGQIVALLGPSGIGKTRLLRIMAGLDVPDGGSVTGPKGQTLAPG